MKRIVYSSMGLAPTAYAVCLPAQTCAQVSSLVDVDFGEYDLVTSTLQNIGICAYVQDDDEIDYSIMFEGSGAANAFTNGVSTVDYALG